MKVKAYAKINIGLKVVGTREDGYHLLDMVMQTVDIFDEIEITPRDDGQVIVKADNPDIPTDGRSLVRKAVRALTDHGFDIMLKTNIPTQAGMGGGSSDCAEVLKAVNEILSLGKTASELEEIAVRLGADVPFFIKGGCQRCRGIGEILSPAVNPYGSYCVVVKPNEGASTVDIYKEYDSLGYEPACANVLEAVTSAKLPIIKEIEQILIDAGADFASMTGSGSATFGLFREKAAADRAAEMLSQKNCGRYKVFITKTV